MNKPRNDNPEWTAKDFARARPASEVIGKAAAASLVRKGGRPAKPAEERKQQVTMRLSPDVLAAARATGPGWQTRVDDVLRRTFVGDGIVGHAPVKAPRGASMYETASAAAKAAREIGGAPIAHDSKLGRMLTGKPRKSESKKRA